MIRCKHIFCMMMFFLVLVFAAGCEFMQPDPSISNASDHQKERYYGRLMLQTEELSFRTANFLRGNLFDGLFSKDPEKLLKILEDIRKDFGAEEDDTMLEIMSDICYCIAQRTGNEDVALRFYLSSAYYSYQLLFLQKSEADSSRHRLHLDRFDPSNCQQLLRYNASIARIFEYLRKREMLDNDSYELKTATGIRICFESMQSELPFALDVYSDFIPCASFYVNDLALINRQFGIGIPLITLVASETPYKALRLPKNCPMPATAVLHFEKVEGSPLVNARFQLFDTTITERIDVMNQPVPLALDYSTPVAAFSRYLPGDTDNLLMNVIDPQRIQSYTGLYMLEPYNPKKIPVVLVHGLMSSPSTWIRMVNALRNYPFIRRNYQFWFYKYSSGNPVLISAIPLRDALLAAEKEFATTPEAKRSFSQMVIAGHSMGGLITAVITQDDPEYFIECFSGKKWEDLSKNISAEDRKKLENAFFQCPPFVKRVVFMAVPHRGSIMAKWMLARFGSSLIRLPGHIFTQVSDLVRAIGILNSSDILDIEKYLYTGVDNLDPDNRFIKMLSKSEFASKIPRHSIIGNRKMANTPGGTDGVVSYTSAHLDDVQSELIVKSGHSVHQSPETIRELVRILRIHLKESEKNGFVPNRDHVDRLKSAPEKRELLQVIPEKDKGKSKTKTENSWKTETKSF